MQVTITRTIYVAGIIPPRCRRPRGGYVHFPVLCAVPEADPDALRVVAETLTHGFEGAHATTIYHHLATGFLMRLDASPDALPALLGEPARSDAIPSRDLPGQALHEIAAATRETRARAAELALIGDALFAQTREPVYLVEYHPSINYDTLSLTVRSAPGFTDTEYGTSDRDRGALPHHARLFNARQRADAEALLQAIAAADAHRARHGHIDIDNTDRITVLVPEVFTFDAVRWHAAREAAHVRRRLATLFDDLAQPFPHEGISALLYPERLALATALRLTLSSAALVSTPRHPDGSRTAVGSAQQSVFATKSAE